MTAPRRHRVTPSRARKALLRAGFTQQLWPAPPGRYPQWILTWHDRHNLIEVVTGRGRGHQVVILGHHDGQRWHADDEQPYRDHVAAVRAALAQWHRVRPKQRQEAA